MLTLFAVMILQRSPETLIYDVLDRYKHLDSLSITVEHENGTSQRLNFLAPARFELKVRNEGDKDKTPDWFCDGERLVTRWPDRLSSKPFESLLTGGPVNGATEGQPAYEVSAGPVLSWLLHSPSGDAWVKAPRGSKIEFAWGSRIDWRDQPVREITVSIDRKPPASLFVSADGHRLLGMEAGKRSINYRDEKDNIVQMPSLGTFK